VQQYAAAESRLDDKFASAGAAFANSSSSGSQSAAATAAKNLAADATAYANGLAALHPPASVAPAANAVIADVRDEASLLTKLASAISSNDESTGTAVETQFESLATKVQTDTSALSSALTSAEK
jgi:hypothetical protein